MPTGTRAEKTTGGAREERTAAEASELEVGGARAESSAGIPGRKLTAEGGREEP